MPPPSVGADAAASLASSLNAVFGRIAATRMADFPLSQPEIRVEAVGFRAWEATVVGVLVLPWAMNLVIAAHPDLPPSDFAPLPTGRARVWQFPSGEYECYGLDEPGLPHVHLCSLYSPMREFSTHDEARAVASAIMEALFIDPAASASQAAPPSPARRQFLRGQLSGAGRDVEGGAHA